MTNLIKIRRRSSDYEGGYHPPTGTSTNPEDFDYVRRNIPCQWACPALTDIPGYIKATFDQDYAKAYTINLQANLFPGILGRVCSRPCENSCRHGDSDLGEPVSICSLKRQAGDSSSNDYPLYENKFAQTGKRVAVIGGGPAGLAAANSLALFGHRVTIYEAKAELGGMLLYGIPDFRVSPDLVRQEIYNILRSGVQVVCNTTLGRDITLSDLHCENDAVIIALGCYKEKPLEVSGEELPQVYSGLEFMIRANEKKPFPIGRKVAVIGGGFTAMDCSRTALRQGADEVINFIRRTEEDIAVTKEEIYEAKKEGVTITSLVSPLQIIGSDKVQAIRFIRNRLVGSPDGHEKKAVSLEDSEFTHEVDTVIIAIGQGPDLAVAGTPIASLDFDSDGCAADSGFFMAGDCQQGASTVIEAIGHAQKVAVHCDQFLMGRRRSQWQVTCDVSQDTKRERAWDFLEKTTMPTLEPEERFAAPDAEVEIGFSEEAGKTEASRCYLCNLRYAIHIPECIYCRWCIDLCPRDCIQLTSEFPDNHSENGTSNITKTKKWNKTAAIVIDSERCIRCGECLKICPTQCINVTQVGLSNSLLQQSME
jgi:glutamate synthase (NADPH) small chain